MNEDKNKNKEENTKKEKDLIEDNEARKIKKI